MIKLHKVKGQVQSAERVVEQFRRRLDTLPNGEYDVKIERHDTRRSLNQNRLMWMWFNCVAAESGTPAQDVHDYYCARFLRRSVVVGGAEHTVVGGTRALNERAMAAFLDAVQSDVATELGITLPSPDDDAWADFENQYK